MIEVIKKMTSKKENKIAFRTCFSSISYYGHKLDKLKSGVQKYLRRREFEKMLWCVAEIYLFQVYAESEKEIRSCKGIISNLINRLIVMMDEEMCFIEYEKYVVIRQYMEKYERGNRGNFIDLYKICKILIESRIVRRNSDIRAYWDYKRRTVLKDEKIESDQEYMEKFIECFKKKDFRVFEYMFKIFNKGEEGSIRRFGRKENIYMIWEFLLNRSNIKCDDVLKACLEYKLKEFHKKKRKERFLFLTSAIDIALHCGIKENYELKLSGNKVKELFNKFDDENETVTSDILRNVFKNRKNLAFDHYVIDKHCSEGRSLKKSYVDFLSSGSYVVDEDEEFLIKDWRDAYMRKDNKALWSAVNNRKKTDAKVEEKKNITDRAAIRQEKYKRIKKMRGKPDFDDLEKNLEWYPGFIDDKKIKLCADITCGNKVMCFEYEGKIWKESRKSMNYNRDYCVVDECKEAFGLRKIGMKRVLADFRIEKIDKSKKHWADNWHRVIVKEGEEPVVYCIMNKVNHCNWKVPMELTVIKHSFPIVRRQLKEFVKIGVFRGIFRCSDFNCRNVLVGCDKSYLQEYFVSIDEGDIGKRLDILGKKDRWVVQALNKDKSIIKEIIDEVLGKNETLIWNTMKKYCFSDDLCYEVKDNMKKLIYDLQQEGVVVEFD